MLRQLILLAVITVTSCGTAYAERIKDLANFAGVRSNSLVGYGLVVGLDGSGDQTMQAPFTGQSMTNMLAQLGVTIPPGTNMQLRNVAAVMVTATLPAFARPGQQLDVVVSSIGNARSLRGGTLLMTPLKGADGQVYALAQGNLLINGASAESQGSSAVINQQAGGRISNGATVERQVALDLARMNLQLNLKEADFTTALNMVDRINNEFGYSVASAIDGGSIELQSPQDANDRVRFMARVENIDVRPGAADPRVVLNSRTGSVVLSGPVTLRQAAVAHGNLSVTIASRPFVSQPPALSGGDTVTGTAADITIEQEEASLQMVEGVELMEVVQALNSLGATPSDLMAILQALQASGALRAELEII
ncbi:flagellar basal body P-ring protein FlgI [Pseudidiomarina tainanensis]|uniref:Flagellar P-ring protein n=2 Tax=Pseudidiomarina TaxID=2800384 RepID=A0A1I6HPC3_9GAMM|nr:MULTISPECIES: flagellar basal body P-ring protein FlgI [Pseudidiomarina]RZQ55809.1 flagellar basal body P-ring protein FlgI [Pseudidiomarina tainanensis]SFR56120.1 flagellar P-ring protein precursor FlgI [Pseudidiomarina maritima]